MISSDKIKIICDEFYSQGKLGKNYAIAFVYNSEEAVDDLHKTECVAPIERQMIVQSFLQIAYHVYSFDSEKRFISAIDSLKAKHSYVLVYSMAQNVKGVGRRTLIPLICQYYDLINISSSEYASFLSGDKKLMYTLLKDEPTLFFPKTYYIDQDNIRELETLVYSLSVGKYVIKPNDESASIGVRVYDLSNENRRGFLFDLSKYGSRYPSFCIQEFIDGKELEVPLVKMEDYCCPGVCEIVLNENSEYLDYDTVGMDAYGFREYTRNTTTIISAALTVAKKLSFDCISRIDFRLRDERPYVIDIGANPTVSTNSSTNYLMKKRLGRESSVYHVLVIRALMNLGLFKPTLNQAE